MVTTAIVGDRMKEAERITSVLPTLPTNLLLGGHESKLLCQTISLFLIDCLVFRLDRMTICSDALTSLTVVPLATTTAPTENDRLRLRQTTAVTPEV